MIAAGLRPYQIQAIDDVRSAIRSGKRRIMLQIPTGGGKTLTGASMIAGAVDKGSRSLFVAHRLELIDQTVTAFARLGILSLGVIRSNDRRSDPSQPIQVASVQTLARRRQVVRDVKLVFVDEAHRAAGASYERHVWAAYPDAVIVGLSATPCRTDGKPLGKYFDAMVSGPSYSSLIKQGHLVEPYVYSTPVLPDLSSVRTVAGDYNAEDLEAAVNRSALIGSLLSEWRRRASDRRTVIFAVSVAHSKAIVQLFSEDGVRAEHLDGTTPEDLRRGILARLASGETQVVVNVGVLCEGWDLPSCKCLVLARPTKSLVLYMQMAGRILRPFEGVKPIILDHGGNVDRHGMPHADREWSLEDQVQKGGTAPAKTCPACFAMIGSAMMSCPHCGHEFPVAPEPLPLPKVDPLLEHVELALRNLPIDDDPQAAAFKKLAMQAREKGWKPGAAYHRFVDRFQREPDHAWTKALRRAYKADDAWQSAVNGRMVNDGMS